MPTMLTALFLAAICLIFVRTLLRTNALNAQLRALDKAPMRNAPIVIAFVACFLLGFLFGLLAVDGYAVYRNSRARRLLAARRSQSQT